MVQLVGIVGSLRAASYNRMLLNAALQSLPDDARMEIVDLSGVPLYNQDIEDSQGIPLPVMLLKDKIAAADGLVICTPEYNGGIPGVLKNGIDWLSRPVDDQPRVLHGKRVALLGATPGGLGTTLSQNAWLQVFRALRMELWNREGAFYLSRAWQEFDDQGDLQEVATAERLHNYITAFVEDLKGTP
ncbi:NADPH-dependent FMN reductase [Marinobacterium arenosum]|uniref:NADPH-dependent FMN reductase n=1 Tax=Marinobacterium arenosum TaxID=2862496 RepID=UPI001C945C57|nr:NAD(P)H-dependent oxidoreductase [Marinobacterium arenosum]MBY4676491.1 NAD(P)H-dependent oxidoreductase [Marinobacterium arenosum]